MALALLIAACAPEARDSGEAAAESGEMTEEYASPADAATLVAALTDSYETHYNLGHADMVADLYTDDAVVLAPNSEIAIGQDAIESNLEEFIGAMSPQLTINPIEQISVGDWVIDHGTYSEGVTPEGQESATLTGSYLALARRVDDGLQLHRLAVNNDAPVPGQAPEMMESEAMMGGPMSDLIASYQELYNAHDAAGVAALWTDDAVAMYADRPAMNGRAEIEAALQELMSTYDPQLTITDVETLMLDDETAIDRGTIELEMTIDGQSVTRTGTYLVLNQKADDGMWKLHWGISNFAPMPMM